MLVNALRALGALLLFVPRSRAVVPIVLWTALIGWLGSWSSDGVGDLGGGILLTNFAHAPLYGVLGLWLALAVPRQGLAVKGRGGGGWPLLTGRRVLWSLVGGALVGVADEAHQWRGDRGRDFSLLDVVTDVTGAGCVVWITAYLGRDGVGDRGLALRLALGLGACLAAAALATWAGELFPGVSWL